MLCAIMLNVNMLSGIMLRVIMLTAVMLNVILPDVMAPFRQCFLCGQTIFLISFIHSRELLQSQLNLRSVQENFLQP
jgi:hypothetical protein